MKTIILLALFLKVTLQAVTATLPLENFSPHLPSTTPIIWAATTNWPKQLWTYKRVLPHIFPASVISNAMVLSSLEKEGIPPSTTNTFYLAEHKPPNYPGVIPTYFGINPGDATLYYGALHPSKNLDRIPDEKTLLNRARKCSALLDVDLKQVVVGKPTPIFNTDSNFDFLTNQICGSRVFFARRLDGLPFYDHGAGEWNEGLSFELESGGKLRSFFLDWPELRPVKLGATATLSQIIALIKAHRIIVIPDRNEDTYFERVKSLATAKKFTIVRLTPCYTDGAFAASDESDDPPKFATPIAEVDAIAELPNKKLNLRMLCPFLSAEISHVLEKRAR